MDAYGNIQLQEKKNLDTMNSLSANAALGSLIANAMGRKRSLKAIFDFNTNGGLIGTYQLLDQYGVQILIPANAIISKVMLDFEIPLTSLGGTAAISLQVESAQDVLASALVNTLANRVDGIQTGNAAQTVKTSVDRFLKAVITGEAVTAGRFSVYLDYLF